MRLRFKLAAYLNRISLKLSASAAGRDSDWCGKHGQPGRKTLPGRAMQLQVPAMQFGKGLDQGQAETGALGMFGAFAAAGMLEWLLDAHQVFRRHARAIVFYDQDHAVLAGQGG